MACPYPKLKRPLGYVAGRAFLRGCLFDLPLFKRGQPAKKGLCVTSGKSEKDLGKDKPYLGPAFLVRQNFIKHPPLFAFCLVEPQYGSAL